MHQRAAAHQARLQRHIQIAIDEAIVTEPPRRIAQRDDLRMGSGIVRGNRLIEAFTDNHAVLHQHRADRHLAQRGALIRQREGAALANLVLDRLQLVAAEVQATRDVLPQLMQQQRNRITTRITDLGVEVDPGRLEQELVYLAQKADVEEELDRLDTHIAEVRRTLNKGGPCGRRLDFLMQELNREANTLSSKSQSATTTQNAVELKVLIEQMREQIQNIE